LSLGVLEAGLSQERFFRIHRSYLVNLDRVQKVIREGNAVTLLMADNDCHLPVSRNRAKDFLVRVGLK
jgi:DNA-binding LytR/AlgR family response regulator